MPDSLISKPKGTNNFMNILAGQIEIDKQTSDFNGELTVIKDIFYGTYIKGGGLPQSGGLAEIIWRNTLNKVKGERQEIKDCLILGLGGGGIAKLVRNNWGEDVKITGVDIDPVIVDLGKKYLKLEEQDVLIKIQDVNDYIKAPRNKKQDTNYDLICIDTYQGDQFPKEFETEKFAKKIKSLLKEDLPHGKAGGIAIFNRLYGPEDRKLANNHAKVLEKVFEKVDRNYPEANIMFICS